MIFDPSRRSPLLTYQISSLFRLWILSYFPSSFYYDEFSSPRHPKDSSSPTEIGAERDEDSWKRALANGIKKDEKSYFRQKFPSTSMVVDEKEEIHNLDICNKHTHSTCIDTYARRTMRNGANLIMLLEEKGRKNRKNARMKRKFIIIRVYCSAAVNCAPDDAMLFNSERDWASVYSIYPTSSDDSLLFTRLSSARSLRDEIKTGKMECPAWSFDGAVKKPIWPIVEHCNPIGRRLCHKICFVLLGRPKSVKRISCEIVSNLLRRDGAN